MKKLLVVVLGLLLLPSLGFADGGGVTSYTARRLVKFNSAPSSCKEGDKYYDLGTHIEYTCGPADNTWTAVLNGSSGVPSTRTIFTTSPLGGGGDLSADRTFTCTTCLVSGGALGTPSSGTGTNLTGIPESGVTNLTTDLAGKQATGNYITALSGDVTATGPGSVAATIANGAVTLAKQANMATASVMYRKTAGSGAPEVQTLATLKTDLGLTGTNSGDQTITGGTCTNQLVSAISTSVVPTCATVALGTMVSGTLSVANGGTGNATGTATVNANLTGPITSIGNATSIAPAPTLTDLVTNTSTTQLAARYLVAGQEFFQAANTDTAGPALVLDINRTNNRRLMICDSSQLTVNTSNQCIRFSILGTGAAPVIDAVATDSATGKNLEVSGVSITKPASTATLTIAAGKTLTYNNSLTITSTDGITMTTPTTSFTAARTDAANNFTGTTTNDSVGAGIVGEYQTGTVAANTTTMSTGTSVNVGANTNFSLTAGDWDCTGVINFTFGSTTSVTNLSGGLSTTTGTLPAQDSYFDFETAANIMTSTAVATYIIPTVRFSLSGTTNVFLVAQATFTASTLKTGGTYRCRRMR